jgi:hypothetical protein
VIRVLLPASLLAGCVRNGRLAETGADPVLRTPAIASFTVRCDADDADWRIDATADGITAGATSVWSADGLYVEVHEVPVSSSREDGTEDVLVLELAIEADWREAKPDKSTAFTCLSGVAVGLALRAPDGSVADCSFHGDASVLGGIKGAPACP